LPVTEQRVQSIDDRTKGLLMAYKLLDMAQVRWRRRDGASPLPLVRAGIVFVDGVQKTPKGQQWTDEDKGGLTTPRDNLGTDVNDPPRADPD
jgi:hypothetical protein